MRRVTQYSLIAFIAFGVVIIVFEALIWLHPPLLALGLGLLDRKPMCGSLEVYRGARQHSAQFDLGRQIRQSTRKIETDPAGFSLWETPYGKYWVPKASEHVLSILLAQQVTGIYSSGENRVKPGDIVFDCGAHVGVYARRALDAGARLVVAIEPAPSNVEALSRNFKDEIASGRLVVSAKGVWDREDVLPLYQDPENSAGDSFVIRSPRDVITRNIPLTTIDNIVAELKLSRIDVIKMDIKGATERALQGAAGALAAHKPRVVIATEEADDNPVAISRRLIALGYSVSCGTCSITPAYTVNPDVLFFQ